MHPRADLNHAPTWLSRHPRLIALFPFLLYALLVVPAVWVRRNQINPDAICYIRLSTYLLRRDWRHAISGYWSPLFPWCMSPFLAMGLDGLHAAHVTLALIGGLYLFAARRLLRRFESLNSRMVFWMRMISAVIAVRLVVRIISPDLLMAALLLFYLAQMHRRDLLQRLRAPFVAGLLGGMLYLAKAYAFPFFLAHFPLTLLLRWWLERRAVDPGNRPRFTWLFAAIASGLAGCALIAFPWIMLLSHSYGRLTISTAGPFNHNEARSAPEAYKYRFSYFVPPDPYLLESEIIDRRVHRFWSPFDSREQLNRQWRIVKENLPDILATLGTFDRIWLVPLSLVIASAIGIRMLLRRQDRHSGIAWEIPWLAMTMLIYCSGFTLVYFEPRLIAVALRLPAMLLCILLTIHLIARMRRLNRAIVVWIVLGVFAISACIDLAGAYANTSRDDLPRAVADAMRSAGLRGPLAGSSRGFGGYVAYFLDAKLITLPTDESSEELERHCDQANVRCVLIHMDIVKGHVASPVPLTPIMQMVQHRRWIPRLTIADPHLRIDVYERMR